VGTHGVLGIVRENGVHECVERTMDGYNLAPSIVDLINAAESEKQMIEMVEQLIGSAEFGSGSVERGTEREHNQEYFALFDLKKRELSLYGIVLRRKTLEKLFSWNWDLGNEGDCCEEILTPEQIAENEKWMKEHSNLNK